MSDPTIKIPGASFEVLQNTQINSSSFKFEKNKNVSYPVAPFIAAKFYTPVGGPLTIKIRATLYMNSKDAKAPKVAMPIENDSVLTMKYLFDIKERHPKKCNVWYVEVDYTSPTVGDITSIISYMVDLDPQLSRGTVTQVGR